MKSAMASEIILTSHLDNELAKGRMNESLVTG